MRSLKVAKTVSVVLFVLLASACLTAPVLAQDASISIDSANNSINQAYSDVLKAEKAGGDVSNMLSHLNNAANLLSEAQNAYRAGDTSQVNAKTAQAENIAIQVQSQAATLAKSSAIESQNVFMLTLAFSVIGAILVFAGFFFGWRYFKKVYIKKKMSLTPEVNF
jgi:hypothetical protein